MSEPEQIAVLEDMVDFNVLLMNRSTPVDLAQNIIEYMRWANGLFTNFGIDDQKIGTLENLELLITKLAQKKGLLTESQVLQRRSNSSQVVIRDDGTLVVNVNGSDDVNVASIRVSYNATDGYLVSTRDGVDLQLHGIALQLALGHGDFVSQVRLSEVIETSRKSFELKFVSVDDIARLKESITESKHTESSFSPQVLIVGMYDDGSYSIGYSRIFDRSKNSIPTRQFETGLRDNQRRVELVSSLARRSNR